MFGNSTIGILLLITHILACITVGLCFRFWKNNYKTKNNLIDLNINDLNYSNKYNNNFKNNYTNVNFSNLGEILGKSIANSISTILMIGGFVVIFSSIISILKTSGILGNSLFSNVVSGLLEVTNGINSISNMKVKNISLNIIITSFLLGFGGLSILLQVLSITSKTDLSIKPYIYGKILHGIFASIYTYLFIHFFTFLNFNL